MRKIAFLVALSVTATGVFAGNAVAPNRTKYGGECTLMLNGAKQNCGPEIVVSHVPQAGKILHTFLTAFFPTGESEVTLISVGGFGVKRGPVEVGYDTSYAVAFSTTHILHSKEEPNTADATGQCNTKSGNDLILIHCTFSVGDRAYEYTFRGQDFHDTRPLFSAD